MVDELRQTALENDRASGGMSGEYPRVLIMTKTKVNPIDGMGASLLNWFHNWPRTSLAQLYSSDALGSVDLCAQNYLLGPADRRFGRLFTRLKGSVQQSGSTPIAGTPVASPSPLRRIGRWLGGALTRSGIWELVFPPRISPALERWIRDFDPEIIYAQGIDLSFAWLPVLVHRRFHLPVCVQISDDWPATLYRNVPSAPLMRPFVRRAFRQLACIATVRLGTGERMQREYLQRYGLSFEPMMICDEPERFAAATPQRPLPEGPTIIGYSGSLGSRRWESLLDLCRAVRMLNQQGYHLAIVVYTGPMPPEAAGPLAEQPELQILPPPSHDTLPGCLKGMDFLFLPEAFDPVQASTIRYSISTKAHLYMMSERPILVYGPAEAGVVEYALTAGWAQVVDTPDPVRLADALRQLLDDQALRARLLTRAGEIARLRHDARKVREHFRDALSSAALRKPASETLERAPSVDGPAPRISIIVLSHNRLHALQQNLQRLSAVPHPWPYELIVVDNASTDGTADWLTAWQQEHPSTRVIVHARNLGVAQGRNAGLRAARGQYLVCLDDDASLAPEQLAQLPSVFTRHPEAGILAFRIRHARTHAWENDHGDTPCAVANFHGAAHAFRAGLLREVGYLDDACTFGGEEIDMAIRARAAGQVTLYIPEIVAEHDSYLRSGPIGEERRRQWVWNYTRVLHKHFPTGMASLFSMRYVLSHLISGMKALGLGCAIRLCAAAWRGRAEGRRSHRRVSPETVGFYRNPALRPEYGNVPICTKIMRKIRQLMRGRR
ncbi:MAG: glycosyltransferase [Armatimonadota bacterium]